MTSQGKLKWTDKISDLVPGLALKDEYANSVLTLEDILSHRTGVPAYVQILCFLRVSDLLVADTMMHTTRTLESPKTS